MSQGDGDSGDLAAALDAYETAPAIMLACEGDDMVLASANEAAREAFGDRCEFGRPLREIAPEVDQRTKDLMDDMAGTVLATGQSVTRPAHRVQVQADDQAPFEVVWDLTFSPWFAADGSVRGVLAHGLDVTQVARAGRDPDHLHELIAMQDALLPEYLPVLPGVEIAGRYLLAEDELSAGGDWYDAVALTDGRVALVVGDVVGHGVAAAAAMGRLRSVSHERLRSGAGLDQVMVALDAFAASVPDANAATVCALVLDPATGQLEYCTAGHPPPLVVSPDGRSRYLRHSGAAPLATTGEMRVAADHLEEGDLVVLYTDGILERPGRSPAASTVELGQMAADAAAGPHPPRSSGPAERVCQQALEGMTRRSGYADDIALLVAQVTGPPAPLHLDLVADHRALPTVLEALATWLESMRVRELDHIVVQHAVEELVTNVVEHAYPTTGSPGWLMVDAALLPAGDVEIRFIDGGVWVPPYAGGARGRGLSMVRGMVDRLVVRGGDDGTVAIVRHRLSRPAWMLTGASTAGGPQRPERDEGFTFAADAGGLHLTGSLDHTALDDLRGALDDVAQSGRVVVLDLEGVTRLPSSAVQALHVASRDAADRGQDLVLYAPAGTTAQQVLELVRLPYVLTLNG